MTDTHRLSHRISTFGLVVAAALTLTGLACDSSESEAAESLDERGAVERLDAVIELQWPVASDEGIDEGSIEAPITDGSETCFGRADEDVPGFVTDMFAHTPSGEVCVQVDIDDLASAEDGVAGLQCYTSHESCGSCGSNRMRWHQLCSNGYTSVWNTWCANNCIH